MQRSLALYLRALQKGRPFAQQARLVAFSGGLRNGRVDLFFVTIERSFVPEEVGFVALDDVSCIEARLRNC